MSSRGRRTVGDLSGRWMRAVLLVASALLFLTWSSTSQAYPWMIRHGFAKCASCHTDPMGGETLTGFGRVMSDTTLSTRWDGGKDPRKTAELFFGVEEPRALSLGGSLRYMDALYQFPKGTADGKFSHFPMQVDAYGELRPIDRLRIAGSLGVSKVPAGSPYATAAQITKYNDGNQYNAVSRSHWIGYDVTDDILVRAGRMNLPFGMRIPEHVMWARSATRTDRESAQQHGVAVSYSAGRIRGEFMGIAGNYQISPDKFRERGYSLYAEYLLGLRTALGVSSLVTHAEDDRFLQNGKPLTRQAHGLTARLVPTGDLAILAEADVLASSQTKLGYVGMLQADYEFAQGFHAMATGELLDAGKSNAAGTVSVPGAGDPKLGGWLTFGWFFFTHFDARVDLVVRKDSPVTLQSQIHYYF
jgi:hypothetical protein